MWPHSAERHASANASLARETGELRARGRASLGTWRRTPNGCARLARVASFWVLARWMTRAAACLRPEASIVYRF